MGVCACRPAAEPVWMPPRAAVQSLLSTPPHPLTPSSNHAGLPELPSAMTVFVIVMCTYLLVAGGIIYGGIGSLGGQVARARSWM